MSPLDETSSLNARVAVLEDWREEHRAWMAEMRSAMAESRTSMTQIQASVTSLRLCSSPNTCVGLSKEIEEMAKENKNAMARIESLERWRTFMSGAATTVGIVWLVFQVLIPWILKLTLPASGG